MQTKADEDEVRAIAERLRKWQRSALGQSEICERIVQYEMSAYSRGKAHAYEAAADYLFSIITPESEED